MAIADEITRLQTAKNDLKTSINAKTDSSHQITTETIDDYADFVDSIQSGGGVDLSEYFNNTLNAGVKGKPPCNYAIKKFPDDMIPNANLSYGFYEMRGLLEAPQMNTSQVTTMLSCFYSCQSLQTIPLYDASSLVNISSMLSDCTSLTNIGGFKDLGKAYLTTQSSSYANYTMFVPDVASVTHDSLMNVINNLYDIASKGVATQSLRLGTGNLAKLTAEEIAIATNKGWTVS